MSSTIFKNLSTKFSVFSTLKKFLCGLIGSLLLLLFAGGGVVYQGISALHQPNSLEVPNYFEVKKGDSLKRVTQRLSEAGVIGSEFWFYWYARYQRIDRKLKAGEYQLLPALSSVDLYQVLISGKSVEYSIQFIEGWNLKQVLGEFANHPKLLREITTNDPVSVAERLQLSQPHAEGMFFPDTYSYHKGMTDVDVLTVAHQRLKDTLERLWHAKSPQALVKTPYEALILASIIEKETGAPEERGLIAGVFTARLKIGMRLQTDPTVIYGLGDDFDGNLTRAHLRQPTPYNTYVIRGLPPTPIAMPGEASIAAAVQPELSDYLYFVAQGDGTHQFSKNLKDHNRAVRKYQLNRKRNYRSN